MRGSILSVFCLVGSLTAGEAPNFSEDVAPIIFNNCASCHRAGEAGPFTLTSYKDVAKRGPFIAAVTQSRYMPPWHASHGDVEFEGARRLTNDQIATIQAWVEGGMPEGDPAKTPSLPEFAQGWQGGDPDVVVEMTESYRVPADGPDQYRYFVLDLPMEQDRWVSAIEFQPGSRATAHHVLGFLMDGEGLEADSTGKKYKGVPGTNDRNRVISWAIGSNPRVYPDDVAIRFKKGQKLVLQTHFHPSGKVELERSRIGLHFAEVEDPRQYVEVLIPPGFGDSAGIAVPAGTDRYSLRESFTLPVDVKAFSAFSHAHYIGKEFRLTAHLPGGESKTLLAIPDYDFAWQELYNFSEYVELPAGTRLESYVRWDNRAANPRNPFNPPQEIRWGPFSDDEMGSNTLDVVTVNPEDEATLRAALKEHRTLANANFYLSSLDAEFKPKKSIARRGRKALERFDEDGDGKFSAAEKAAARAFLTSKGFDEGAARQPSD